jgi:pimeloyl-ACP methyl ester carboxylesterase
VRFVFVHGGFHGAWCWARTIDALGALGHDAIAVDMPGHGERRDVESTFASRLETIVSVLESGDVLVGHSGGGFEITLAADAVPERIGRLVYLAAALPREGRTMPESMTQRDGDTDSAAAVDEVTGMVKHLVFDADGGMRFADIEGARATFYHDCDDATVRWAFDRLCPEYVGDTATTPISVPDFWAADLPRAFIRCEQDRAMPRWFADLVSLRLGVEPLTIDASHSPFLSRPRELAELLAHATTTQPIAPLRPE